MDSLDPLRHLQGADPVVIRYYRVFVAVPGADGDLDWHLVYDGQSRLAAWWARRVAYAAHRGTVLLSSSEPIAYAAWPHVNSENH